MTSPGRGLLGALVTLGNAVLFSFGLFPLGQCGQPAGCGAALLLCYFVLGGVTRIWSRRCAFTAIGSLLGLAVGGGLLRWSGHLTDTGGDFSYPVWRYVLPWSWQEGLLMAGMFGAAIGGWWLSDRVFSHRRVSPAASSQ
jgi:hypothetical protein